VPNTLERFVEPACANIIFAGNNMFTRLLANYLLSYVTTLSSGHLGEVPVRKWGIIAGAALLAGCAPTGEVVSKTDHVMLSSLDIILRLGAATLTGFLIGIWLDWNTRPAGMRTIMPVALGSAVAVLAADLGDNAAIPVIQGVITGVGFLGGGVIMDRRGVPTAAIIWLTASLGVLCGLGSWSIWIIAVVLTPVVLVGDVIAKPVREFAKRVRGPQPSSDESEI
jgi:putative Mg2+ transporter-C (MgtC) family protein